MQISLLWGVRVGARLRWLAVALLPCVAFAAEQTVRAFEPGSLRFWAAFGAVQLLSLFGYACSSLPDWANWKDTTGTAVEIAARRLKILQGTAVGVLAGNAAYYLGFYYGEFAEIACFIGAAVAAYGGDKFLTPVLARVTGRVPA